MKELIKNIDNMLGNPNYALTQYNLYEGGAEVHSLARMAESCWWEKFKNIPAAIAATEKLLSMNHVLLGLQEIPQELFKQYIHAAEESYRLGAARPYEKILLLKERNLRADDTCAAAYDIKAACGRAIGYGSIHSGLNPETMGMLIGNLELSCEQIVIAGVGTGDIIRFGLPSYAVEEIGIDISARMMLVAWNAARIDSSILGNASDRKTWSSVRRCGLIVADYFLDITEHPVAAIQCMSDALLPGGTLVITILAPIDQVGFDSLKPTENADRNVSIKENQDIGNTKNPWSDALKLVQICETFGLQRRAFSVTSYLQYDSGRKNPNLPFEARPSFILVFAKKFI